MHIKFDIFKNYLFFNNTYHIYQLIFSLKFWFIFIIHTGIDIKRNYKVQNLNNEV